MRSLGVIDAMKGAMMTLLALALWACGAPGEPGSDASASGGMGGEGSGGGGCKGKDCVRLCSKDEQCQDDDPCNGEEQCVKGECKSGSPASCDDGDPCNGEERCEPREGCVYDDDLPACTKKTKECGHCQDDPCEFGESSLEEICAACVADSLSCSSCDECIWIPVARCGDSVTQHPLEECDDGNAETEICLYGEITCETCDSSCKLVTVSGPFCGDQIQNGPEACDGGPACTETCTLFVENPVCGNDALEMEEECDDGNTETEACPYGEEECEVCAESCELEVIAGEFCGDEIVSGPEECDDGNAETEECPYGGGPCEVCSSGCRILAQDGGYCGDGVVSGPEPCDGGEFCTEECEQIPVAQKCEACMRTIPDPDFQAANEELCNTDPLCVDLKACLLNDTSDPDTEGKSCFNYIPATCYCGITRNFDDCEADPNFVALGPCAAETIAAVGTDSPITAFQRLTDFDYPSGKAYQIVDFARQFCTAECGFTRGD